METPTDSAPFADIDAVVDAMTPHETEQRLRQLELQRRAIDAEMAALADHTERRGQFRSDGHRSSVGWLRTHLNASNRRITQIRRCGRLFREHPSVGEALYAGRIGVDQAAELARAHANPRCGHLLGDSLELLLGYAQRLKFDEFRQVVKRWEMFADLDGAEKDRGDAIAARQALIATGGDGVDLIATGGTPLQADGLRAILDAFTDAEYHADRQEAKDRLGDDVADSDLRRTRSQRAFDALVKIFHTANNSPLDGTPPAVTVNVVMDQYSFETQLAHHGLCPEPTDLLKPDPATARSQTASGTPVHPEEAVTAALLGHIRRVVVDSRGVVINYGRKQRLFTGPAADAARQLATRCEHPGCTLPAAWCQIDHMREWEHHGPTNQDNAAIICGHHNRTKHRSGLHARRDRDGNIQLQRPDGTWITPVGTDPPTPADFDNAATRARLLAANLTQGGFGNWTILTRAA
jgi:hypothetical protein